MQYIISIEGQSIPMPEEIAGDDAKIKAALAPYFPGAANSKIMRGEPVNDTVTITVIKQAGTKGTGTRTKGAGTGAGTKLLFSNKVLGHLVQAEAGQNPVVALLEKLEAENESLLQRNPEDLLVLDEKIKAAIQAGRDEANSIEHTLGALINAPAWPSSKVPAGF